MKYAFLTAMVFFAGPLAAGKGPTAADVAVNAVLDDWHQAAAQADERKYFGHLAENAVFLGTDATERWDKKAFLAYAHPHFVKGKAWSFTSVRRCLSTASKQDFAYFDEDLETANLGPARGSGVLQKINGHWKIVQYNLSVPIPNEVFSDCKKRIESFLAKPKTGK